MGKEFLKDAETTTRQQIIFLLQQGPATLHELAMGLGLKEKDAAEHLQHVRLSLKKNEKLIMKPAECSKCAHVFKDRSRVSTPSRCPLCKCERVHPAVFKIKSD